MSDKQSSAARPSTRSGDWYQWDGVHFLDGADESFDVFRLEPWYEDEPIYRLVVMTADPKNAFRELGRFSTIEEGKRYVAGLPRR